MIAMLLWWSGCASVERPTMEETSSTPQMCTDTAVPGVHEIRLDLVHPFSATEQVVLMVSDSNTPMTCEGVVGETNWTCDRWFIEVRLDDARAPVALGFTTVEPSDTIRLTVSVDGDRLHDAMHALRFEDTWPQGPDCYVRRVATQRIVF